MFGLCIAYVRVDLIGGHKKQIIVIVSTLGLNERKTKQQQQYDGIILEILLARGEPKLLVLRPGSVFRRFLVWFVWFGRELRSISYGKAANVRTLIG